MSNLLLSAAKNGRIEVVKRLLEQGANIHADNDFALRLSALNGHIEVVKLLLEQGADIHADNDYALRWSAENGYVELVQLLLDQGADINNAIKHSSLSYIKEYLKKYIKKEFYKGEINEKTETDCGICLTEMNSICQEIIQCKTCKKCVHNECNSKWNSYCVYCRN